MTTYSIADTDEQRGIAKPSNPSGKDYDPNQPRDESGRWGSGGSVQGSVQGSGDSEDQIANAPARAPRGKIGSDREEWDVGGLVEDVRSAWGYPKDKIKFVDGPGHAFEVDGEEMEAAGFCDLKTGKVTFYTESMTESFDNPVELAAHEIMHGVFEHVTRQYEIEQTKAFSLASKKDDVLDESMKLTEKYHKQFPVLAAMQDTFSVHDDKAWDRFEKEDGVTEYSKQWWKDAKRGEATRHIAIHETLAEIAAHEARTGKVIGKSHYKEAYEAVKTAWSAGGGFKKKSVDGTPEPQSTVEYADHAVKRGDGVVVQWTKDGTLTYGVKPSGTKAHICASEYLNLSHKSLNGKIARTLVKAARRAHVERVQQQTAKRLVPFFLSSQKYIVEQIADFDGKGYDPNQPRDELGRFGEGGGSSSANATESREEGVSDSDVESAQNRTGVTPATAHAMIGAPADAKVNVIYDSFNTVVVKASGTDQDAGAYNMAREFKAPSGDKYVVNQSFNVEKPGTGFGVAVLQKQVEECANHGYERIETSAARGSGQNGYYTWPRLGYDNNPSYETLDSAIRWSRRATEVWKEKFSEVTRVSELMATPGGREFWKSYGDHIALEFDLAEGSQSRKVLDAYVQAKRASGKSTGTDNRGRGDSGRDLGSAKSAEDGSERPTAEEAARIAHRLVSKVSLKRLDKQLVRAIEPPLALAFVEGAASEVRLRKQVARLRKAFDPNQPRDADGRFGSGGGADLGSSMRELPAVDEQRVAAIVAESPKELAALGQAAADYDESLPGNSRGAYLHDVFRPFKEKVKDTVEELAKAHGLEFSGDERAGSSYMTISTPDDADGYVAHSFELRVSDHKQKYGGPEWSFDTSDDAKTHARGLKRVVELCQEARGYMKAISRLLLGKATTASDFLDDEDDEGDFDFPTEHPEWLQAAAQAFLDDSFSMEYWHDVNLTTRNHIEVVLRDGIQRGLSMRDIRDAIMEGAPEYSRSRAMNVARTESGGAMNAGQTSSMIEAGMDAREWLSVMGSTTRDEHAEADGQQQPMGEPFTVGGEQCMYPGDSTLSPAMKCNCQCGIVSSFVGENLDDSEE